eukprot:5946755-Ditylum_brightwellii.AAC.1
MDMSKNIDEIKHQERRSEVRNMKSTGQYFGMAQMFHLLTSQAEQMNIDSTTPHIMTGVEKLWAGVM